MVLQLSHAAARIIRWCASYPLPQPELSHGAACYSVPLSGLFRAAVGAVLQRVTPCCCQNYPIRLPTWPAMASIVNVECACYCRRASLNGAAAGPHGAPASPRRADTLPRDAVVGAHGAAAGPRGVYDN